MAASLRSVVLSMAASAAASIALSVAAQAPGLPGSLDRSIVSTTGPLDGPKSAALGQYVAEWTRTLGSSADPADLRAARAALTDPARDPSSTPAFRRTFAGQVLPAIEPIVAGRDLQRAVNALQVARFLRTPESVELIAGRLSSGAEPDSGKRLSAASNLAAAVTDADLSPVQCDAVTRTVVAAAAAERDDQIVLQELKALQNLARRPNLPAGSLEAAQAGQIKVFADLVQSVAAAPKADPRMASVARALVSLRNQWLDLPRPQAMKLGPTLAPVLGSILDTAQRHWAGCRDNAELLSAYSIAVASSETLLRLIDRTLRPAEYPAPKPGAKEVDARTLATAWDDGKSEPFGKEVQRWQGILKNAPYGRN